MTLILDYDDNLDHIESLKMLDSRLTHDKAKYLSRMMIATKAEIGEVAEHKARAWFNTAVEMVATCKPEALMVTLEVVQELAFKELRR